MLSPGQWGAADDQMYFREAVLSVWVGGEKKRQQGVAVTLQSVNDKKHWGTINLRAILCMIAKT